MNQYEQWIYKNVPGHPVQVLGKCTLYVPLMAKAFPELTIVKGVVFSYDNIDNNGPYEKEYPHMWLITPDEEIIDPTSLQFINLGKLIYKPMDMKANRLLKCLWCGKYFTESTFDPCCSKDCHILNLAGFQ